VSGISVLVWVVCGALVGLLLIVVAGQKVAIKAYTDSIKTNKATLEKVEGLKDALTAQQHLASLPQLYDKRAYFSKFFKAYAEADPTDVTLTSLAVDDSNLLTAEGTTKTYAEVAKLARALAALNVTVGTGAATDNTPYFSDVTIKTVGKTGDIVTFAITATVGGGATSGN